MSSYSVGLDKVDLVKRRERGIRVTNTPDLITDNAADLGIALILATLRKICGCDRYVRSRLWKKHGDFELTAKFSGKSVGIIGLGRIGSAISKRAEVFGCPISYHSRSQKPNSKYQYPSVVELASNCHILVVASALTEETRHIINWEVINVLGPKGCPHQYWEGSSC